LGEIAEAAGIGRGLLYLHFENKERLFEALVYQEILQYTRLWLDRQSEDPNGGTIAAMYRNALSAIKSRPLMTAFMRRDRRIFGSYLRKPSNLFQTYSSKSAWTETLRQLQEVGAVRQDIAPELLATILDMLSYGLISVDEMRTPEEIPPFDDAGKIIIHRFATSILAQLEQSQRIRETGELEVGTSE
jgi:TetR/AcrR family acrAB operon transcriptional repressor